MKKAVVTFVKYYTYEIEISNETYESGDSRKAVKMAEKNFISKVCSPLANTSYDDVEIEFIDTDEEE